MKPNLTVGRLREVLNYAPETGLFTWKVTRGSSAKQGAVAGSLTTTGYITIRIDGAPFYAHRLAWLYVNGTWPAGEVDHADGNRTHNAIANLRDGSKTFNMQNQRRATARNRTSGLLGVHWSNAAGRFTAQIRASRKTRHLGLFDTAEEAHAAYLAAKRRLHEGNTL